MTRDRHLERPIRVRASETGESSPSARRHVLPGEQPPSPFEARRPSDYLLRAAASAAGQVYKSLAIEQLAIDADDTILDLGCGTGGELAALLHALGSDGSLIGVDTDDDALRVARERFDDRRLRLRSGDAHALDLADESVDRVYVDRAAQHFAAPATVLPSCGGYFGRTAGSCSPNPTGRPSSSTAPNRNSPRATGGSSWTR